MVVFHHCSHGTVLKTRAANRRAGRLISALLLFKRFEDYQREHMMHHSPNKLLTEEDEFADFVMGMCGLEPGVPKADLWRRVVINSVSPLFHLRFLQRRLRASMFTGDRAHDWMSRGAWIGAFALAARDRHAAGLPGGLGAAGRRCCCRSPRSSASSASTASPSRR